MWSKGTKYQSCKMNKYWRADSQHGDRLKYVKKVDLRVLTTYAHTHTHTHAHTHTKPFSLG